MRKGNGQRADSRKPPQLNTHPTITAKYRFTVTSAMVATYCGSYSIQEAIGVMAVTSTSAFPIAPVFRLNRLQIWGTTPAAGSSSVIGVVFGSASQSFEDGSQWQDVSSNPSAPPYLDVRPPKKSLVGNWMQPSDGFNVGLFGITAGVGSIIDMTVSFKLNDAAVIATGSPGGITVAGATVGQMYYEGIDGRVSGKTLPMGRSAI
jgi:hypothetical protein